MDPACGFGIRPDIEEVYRLANDYLRPMKISEFDVAILGGGVVGLSIGISLLKESSKLRVVILEKENSVGLHASGRNSGVLHAGFYYSPDSLKAKFCRDGNIAIKQLFSKFNLPILECGKVVVTQNEEDEKQIDKLFERGSLNGVKLEIQDAKNLHYYEPLAKTFRRFLWSPNTAVANPVQLAEILKSQFLELGGYIKYSARAKIELKEQINLSDEDVSAKHIVNASGAYADVLAKQIGIAEKYSMIPFAGIYRIIGAEKIPLKTLVYPVPHAINPFLGVHFTRTLDGHVKIGPTAIPIFGREQYSWNSGWSFGDLRELLMGSISIIRGKEHHLSKMFSSEWPKFFQSRLIKESAKLVPIASQATGWSKKPPGIRAQLVNRETGKLEQDFVVENFLNSTHVLNAVSPGWTSAIPFGEYVAQNFVLPNLN